MKKAVFYPFSAQSLPLIKYYKNYINDFEIEEVVAPKGIGIENKDIAYVNNEEPVGIIAHSNINTAIDRNELLIVASGKIESVLHTKSVEVMKYAISQSKDVYCMATLPDKLQSELKDYSNKCNCVFTYVPKDIFKDSRLKNFDTNSLAYYKVKCPVIFVGGLLEDADQEEVVLQAANVFKENGYKPCIVGNNGDYELLKHYNYVSIIKDSMLSETQKITYINRYIKAIEQNEKPDVIIVHLCGTFMRYDDILVSDYGVQTFIMSQAVEADYGICCVGDGNYSQEFYEAIKKHLENKYSLIATFFYTSNRNLDYQLSIEKKQFFDFRSNCYTSQSCTSNTFSINELFLRLDDIMQEIV